VYPSFLKYFRLSLARRALISALQQNTPLFHVKDFLMRITVLGCGLVGGPIAIDLSKDRRFSIKAVDTSADALERLKHHNISTVKADLKDGRSLREILNESDFVVSAVPGHMGLATLKGIIEAEKNVVDIAFFPEDPFILDQAAKQRGVTAIVDCGVAPGMSNLLTGYAASLLDETFSVLIYVGGLPQVRQWPYDYKAVFSPIDVIEEYTRPARYVENGKEVVRPALSDPEFIYFPGVGTLEAFNTDGLRTLIHTITAPNMKEKTMRYPGHIEKIAILRETGFFGQEEIEINGHMIRPIDFTAKMLFPMWKMNEGDADLTVMRIEVKGTDGGRNVTHRFELLDRFDELTSTHSMARTTGYTATAAVRLMAEGLYRTPGIVPPEVIGRDRVCVEFMLKTLADRNVIYTHTTSPE
jgi:saccharopine dehydrogenase-like NADP-dependent oxidoreductase